MSQALRKSASPRIIPAESVRILSPAAEEDIPGAAEEPDAPVEHSAHGHEPEIILLKDGGRVKTIVIKCPCGQVTCLECEY